MNKSSQYTLYFLGHFLLILVFLIPLVLVWTFALEYSLYFTLFYCFASVVLFAWIDLRQIQASFLPGKKITNVEVQLAERSISICHHKVELFVPNGIAHGKRHVYMRLSVNDVELQRQIAKISFGGEHKFLVGFSKTLLWYCENPLFGPWRLVGLDIFRNKKITSVSIRGLELEDLRPEKRKKNPQEPLLHLGIRNNILPNYFYQESFVLKLDFAKIIDAEDQKFVVDLNTGNLSADE